ncbi:hypothetical protein ACFQY0_05935 [Haloferula chungangensis]|uniref:YIP1 family protein n=1 Tax=Haloferula chungangensis TaxID=1048331 RepID=A0ABW2L302_9BACT
MTNPSPPTPSAPSRNDHPLPPLPENPNLRDLFEALLRRPAELAGHQASGGTRALKSFTLLAIISMLVFGFVLGTFAYGTQLWAAPLKVGLGLVFAGIICFPSLYIFSSLAGCQASATRLAATLAGMLALAGLLLLGCAPAIWIFAQGTGSFGFMGTLSIGAWLIALVFAFRFIRTVLEEHGTTQKSPMRIWCVIFLLVTLQLTTSLRPILGHSDKLLTDEKKFFLAHWSETFAESLPTDSDAPTAQTESSSDADSSTVENPFLKP